MGAVVPNGGAKEYRSGQLRSRSGLATRQPKYGRGRLLSLSGSKRLSPRRPGAMTRTDRNPRPKVGHDQMAGRLGPALLGARVLPFWRSG